MSDSLWPPWIAGHQASLSITNSQSLLKLMSIKSVMQSNHLVPCHPLFLLPWIFSSIRVFSNESILHIRWPKYWSFSFNIGPSDGRHPHLNFPPPSPALSLPSIKVFSIELALCIRRPKYWSFSFSISFSNGYSGLISLRVDWFDLLVVQDSQESSPAPQFGVIKSSVLSLLYGSTFTSIHDYWKNHSFDYMDFCWQSDVSTF